MKSFKKNSFATPEQELLLRAALLSGADARDAWVKWRNAVGLEGNFDNGSYRLLPLLYMNLRRLGVEDPGMHTLKGIYRHAWYENQRLLYDISKIIRLLHDAGIRTMLLKGAALTVLNYKNHGVRPMSDIDVLVPAFQALQAIDLLKKNGWSPIIALREGDLYYRHSREFRDESGKEIDLHWHPFFDACREDCSRDFWDGAVPITLSDVSTLATNPTDTLLHVIVHGVKWNAEPSIRWIADAALLINSPDAGIDWSRLIAHAEKHRVRLRLREALNYLHDRFQVHIPEAIVNTVNHSPISRLERMEYRHITSDLQAREHALLGGFATCLIEYRRLETSNRLFRYMTGLSKYLRWRVNAKSNCDLFLYIVFRGISKVKNKLLSRPIMERQNNLVKSGRT